MFAIHKCWRAVVCLIVLSVVSTIHAQERPIVISGTVITPEKILKKGWVVIKQGKISRIDEKLPNEPNAILINTEDIILPGFIDLHNHPLYSVFRRWSPPQKFNNRYEWRASKDYRDLVGTPGQEMQRDEQTFCDLAEVAEVMALSGGTTSFSGIPPRRVPDPPVPACFSKLAVRKLDLQSGLNETEPGQERIQNVLGVTPRDLSDTVANEVARKLEANELDLLLIHVAEGKGADPENREFADVESTTELGLLKVRSFLGPRTGIIHGVAFSKNDYRDVRSMGASLIWSPRSNIELYGNTSDVITAFREGVSIALAPDWSPTGSNNMLAELKYVADYNKTRLGGFFSNQQLFEMATSIPARIARIDDKVGSLQPGLFADLFLLRGDTTKPFDTLMQATAADVDLVLVNGVPVYGAKTLMSGFNVNTETVPICGEEKSLNLEVFRNGRLSDARQRITERMKVHKLEPAQLVESCKR